MKLGINDMRARGYRVRERILNICANEVIGGPHTFRCHLNIFYSV